MINNISIIRSSCKNVRIIIRSNADIEVHAPKKMPLEAITKIVKDKEDWINKKLTYIKHNLSKNKRILEYDDVLLFGISYELKSAPVKEIQTQGENLLFPEKKAENKLIYIKKWYRKKSQEILYNRTMQLAESLKINITKVSIVDSKAKWGSCDANKHIKLNWRLIQLPPEQIDFVIFHELMHTLEMNHSKNFFYLLSQVCPNWKVLRANLKSSSFLLKLYK